MKQSEIINMAREAGALPISLALVGIENLERFAALVAAHEREFVIDLVAMYGGPVDLEAAIRARNSTNKCQFDTELVAIEVAVLAEREACAKVCEEGTALTAFQSKDCYSYARNRAAAIRAR